jgi:hypothetical protein
MCRIETKDEADHSGASSNQLAALIFGTCAGPNKALNSGDAILIMTPWDSLGSGSAAQQSDYKAMLYDLAKEKGIGLIDIQQKLGWRSYVEEQGAGNVSDSIHPTLIPGYEDMASVYARVALWGL